MPSSEVILGGAWCSMCGTKVAPKQRRQLCAKHLAMAESLDRRIARRAWDMDDDPPFPSSSSVTL